MLPYSMVKSIHDQRMNQFYREVERRQLKRILSSNSAQNTSLADRLVGKLRSAGESVAAALRPKPVVG